MKKNMRVILVGWMMGISPAAFAEIDDDFADLSGWTVIPAGNWTASRDGDRTVVSHGAAPGGTVLQKSADTGGLTTVEPIDLATQSMHASVTFRFAKPEQAVGLTFGPGSANGGEGSVSRIHLFLRQNGNTELQVYVAGEGGEKSTIGKQVQQSFPTDAFVTVTLVRTMEGVWTISRSDQADQPIIADEKEARPLTGSIRFIEIRGAPDADAPILIDRFTFSPEPAGRATPPAQ